jgi:hypothetical protein
MNYDNTTLMVSADFVSDWTQHMRDQLLSSGYETRSDDSPDETGLKFFNVLHRRISTKPRRILISNEFSCPLNLQDGLNVLKRKVLNGEDANPHLGKKISKNNERLLDARYNDSLLNDWGIRHFHLGTAFHTSGFVQRTGSILFAKVTDDVFYCIDVMEHRNWSNRKLIEIIHSNWPDTISRYRSSSRVIEYNPTDDEIKKLRSGAIYALQLSDGTVYLPIGGGYATSGVSIEVIDKRDYYATQVRQIEQHIRDNIKELISQTSDIKDALTSKLTFKLKVLDDHFLAVEDNLKIAFRYELK